MVSYDLLLFMLKIETSTEGTNSMPFLVFRRDHLQSTLGIIWGSGSFAVQFGDHFRSGDHLRSGIICGSGSFAVQFGDHFRSGDHLRSGIICCTQRILLSRRIAPFRTISVANSLRKQRKKFNTSRKWKSSQLSWTFTEANKQTDGQGNNFFG